MLTWTLDFLRHGALNAIALKLKQGHWLRNMHCRKVVWGRETAVANKTHSILLGLERLVLLYSQEDGPPVPFLEVD